jgi:hypothetical protein
MQHYSCPIDVLGIHLVGLGTNPLTTIVITTNSMGHLMITYVEVTGLLDSLIKQGEILDTSDLTMFYGWMYSAYIALEPFPKEHRKFYHVCLDSCPALSDRQKYGLYLLNRAILKAPKKIRIQESAMSGGYLMLIKRVFPKTQMAQ